MLIRFNFGYLTYVYYNNDMEYHREDGPSVAWGYGMVRYFLKGFPYGEEKYWTIIRFKGYL